MYACLQDYLLEKVAWTRVAEGGVNVASVAFTTQIMLRDKTDDGLVEDKRKNAKLSNDVR